jgi:hypothetical protein
VKPKRILTLGMRGAFIRVDEITDDGVKRVRKKRIFVRNVFREISGRYVRVYAPDHTRANRRGWVYEHVFVAQRALGKPLRRGAEVHHVDGDTRNNDPRNLVICHDRAYHMLLHQRQRALDACGDPDARKCDICHTYDNQHDLGLYVRKNGSLCQPRHLACSRAQKAAHKARLRQQAA